MPNYKLESEIDICLDTLLKQLVEKSPSLLKIKALIEEVNTLENKNSTQNSISFFNNKEIEKPQIGLPGDNEILKDEIIAQIFKLESELFFSIMIMLRLNNQSATYPFKHIVDISFQVLAETKQLTNLLSWLPKTEYEYALNKAIELDNPQLVEALLTHIKLEDEKDEKYEQKEVKQVNNKNLAVENISKMNCIQQNSLNNTIKIIKVIDEVKYKAYVLKYDSDKNNINAALISQFLNKIIESVSYR